MKVGRAFREKKKGRPKKGKEAPEKKEPGKWNAQGAKALWNQLGQHLDQKGAGRGQRYVLQDGDKCFLSETKGYS